VKGSHSFELARLKKKKEKHFGRLVTIWFDTFAMIFWSSKHVVGHEALENEWYIKGLKFTFFFCIIIHCMLALSLHINTLSGKNDVVKISQVIYYCQVRRLYKPSFTALG